MPGAYTPPVFQVLGYATSRDYESLADLMQQQSILCLVDYREAGASAERTLRDVAHTVFDPCTRDGCGVWMISARGIGYVYARCRADFIAACAEYHVEFVPPTKRVRWRSVAVWPPEVEGLGNEANESHDTHDTPTQAHAVCQLLRERGFGGDGRIFPLSTRVEPF